MVAVLNWLWQGTLVALAVTAWLRYAGPVTARTRYRALSLALATVLVLPLMPLASAIVTPDRYVGESPSLASSYSQSPTRSSSADVAVATPGAPLTIPTGWGISAIALALCVLWSTVHIVRLQRARRALARLRRGASDFPPAWEARLAFWTRIARRGRRAELVLSRDVPAAAVLGGRVPLIALSPQLFARLSDTDIDRIVVHEWAHVQRRDDIAHACQLVVHALVGWHPGVALLGRALHLEREVACDEMVVGITGSPKLYAACLARLATLPASALAVVAVASPSMVGRRIARILSPSRLASSASWTISALGGVALCVLSTAVGTFRLVGPMVPGVPAMQLARATDTPLPAPEPEPQPVEADMSSATGQEMPPVTLATPLRAVATVGLVEVPVPDAAAVTVGPEPATEAPTPVVQTPAVLTAAQTAPPVSSPDEPAVQAPAPAPAPDSVLRVESLPQHATPPMTGAEEATDGDAPWTVAAETGIAIGRGSQDAGVAVGKGSQRAAESTAGFFTRLGKRIAGGF